jgi:hypothetical protein
LFRIRFTITLIFLKLRVELRQLGSVQAELGTEGAKWGD